MNKAIPKNAAYHAVKAVLKVWEEGEANHATQYSLRELIATLGSTGIKAKDIKKEHRDWLLENMNSADDLVDFIEANAIKDFEWIEDNNFDPDPVYRGNKYSQKIASSMELVQALHGGVNASAISKAIRDLNGEKPEEIKQSAEFARANGEGKVDTGLGVRDHKYPMNWIKENKLPKVINIKHLANIINKYMEIVWITHEEDDRLNKAGLQRTLPADGTDRYQVVGIVA